MPNVSVLIAARNEHNLHRMVFNLLLKLTGDFEIIIVQDGPPYQTIVEDKSVHVFNREYSGLKPSINFAAAQATGKYLFKLDAHCAISEGIDEILLKNMQWN